MDEKTTVKTNTVNGQTGPVYHMRSSQGMSFGLNERIYSDVSLKREVLEINMRPKRRNKAPVIYYSDITKVTRGVYFSVYWIVIAAILVICALFTYGASILTAALAMWLGYNQKITIYQRNGIITKLYSRKKSQAEDLVRNIQSRMKVLN